MPQDLEHSPRVGRFAHRLAIGCGVAAVVLAGSLYGLLRLSLPAERDSAVAGLSTAATVFKDRFGIPTITAGSRPDALRVLGRVTAEDRLFQMDLLRRRSAGRLAEIFGKAALAMDTEHRLLGFEAVAAQVLRQLPEAQREALEAYAEGVNGIIDRMAVLPFEFLVLGYRPDRWRVEDSILVVLGMFETLSHSERQERMLSVMERALPPEVYRFLAPETDGPTRAVLGEAEPRPSEERIPLDALSALLERGHGTRRPSAPVQAGLTPAGSNAWAVAGSKTPDGRAILANDMHLGISVPNVWYQVHLRYGEIELGGVVLPGTPLIVAGATRRLAFGMTNLLADVLDLVQVEPNPENPDEYRTPEGWRRFGSRREMIPVKGEPAHAIDIKTTTWGPVALQPLMGQPVAIRWTALDPAAVDLGLLDLDRAETLEQGLAIMNRTGGPPLNAILADRTGRIAWTTVGRLPLRQGFDGATSRSWADGSLGWKGFVPPAELPRQVDPPQGFVVNANQRGVGRDYPYPIGHGYASGHRAYRIAESLRARERVTEMDLFRIQLDTAAEGYAYYRELALEVLSPAALAERPERRELREYLAAWDGRAELGSQGIAVLAQFRQALAESVFVPFLGACRERDTGFEYRWPLLDVPLRTLLSKREPRLLPEPERYGTWEAFILARLDASAQTVRQRNSVEFLRDLNWGEANAAAYSHPLSRGIPELGRLLDWPREALPGCGNFCVRADAPGYGASERLVVAPGHPEDGILHMPGGQSGHPLSPHYQDQYRYWVQGLPIGFGPGKAEHVLRLVPDERVSAH